MELRRHFDPKIIFVGLYLILFAVYVIIGLQPVSASKYEISARLEIPAIGLVSDVTELSLNNNELIAPDTIAGSYSQADNKTLLIGHSTTVFYNLSNLRLSEAIQYNGHDYKVAAIDMLPKEKISMRDLLSGANKDTIVLMTCAGTLFGDGDASHRLIITAVR